MSWSRRDVLSAGLAGARWLTAGGVPSSALGDDDDAREDDATPDERGARF